MARYKIWDKMEDIYTPSGARFTAQEWASRYPWVNIPGAKMIITNGIINGGVALEFNATVDQYKRMGANITDAMTDDEIMQAIEDFEDNPPVVGEIDNSPTPEERIAAALEFQNLMAMSDT